MRFNALRLFLLGLFKAHIYTVKPTSIDALEDNIEAFIRDILGEVMERVCQNWTKRMEPLRLSRGLYLHEIIVKYKII